MTSKRERRIAVAMLVMLALQMTAAAVAASSLYVDSLAGVELTGGVEALAVVAFVVLGLLNWAAGHAIGLGEERGESADAN